MSCNQIVDQAAAIEGWMERGELGWLADRASGRETIIEVGSWKGRSTKVLAGATPGVVIAVDHWSGSPSRRATTHKEAVERGPDGLFGIFQENLREEIRKGKVIPIRMESGEAVAVVKQILEGRGGVDMVFIDGDHEFEAVSADLMNYGRLLQSGGLLSGHDYSEIFPGVKKAVDLFLSNVKLECGSIWYSIRP